jgi:hypothetical protein
VVTLVLTLALAGFAAGWTLTGWRPAGSTDEATPSSALTSPEETTSQIREKAAFSLPREDVPGTDVPDLPRYPGSVRVEYERKEQELLVLIRVRYLSHTKLDLIRGFYRGVFRSKNWMVANAEFSEGEWTFLIVDGGREAVIEIGPHRSGVTRVDIESSEPQPTQEATPEQRPRQEASPATPETLAPAPPTESTPTPQPPPVSAPDDDYYEGGGGDQDDLGDEGGDD